MGATRPWLKASGLNARVVAARQRFVIGSRRNLLERQETDRLGAGTLSRGPGIHGEPQGNSEPRWICRSFGVVRLHALFMPIARMLILVVTIKREEQE